jgi:hypothetical protein
MIAVEFILNHPEKKLIVFSATPKKEHILHSATFQRQTIKRCLLECPNPLCCKNYY